MSPDEDKKLRQLLRMSHQLPEPDWNLFNRTTKRWSRLRPEFHKMETQQKETEKLLRKQKKKDDKARERDEK